MSRRASLQPGAGVDAHRAVEATVRAHAGRVMGGLLRTLGDFALAEDVFQEAVARALERWPVDGIPRNPPGWIVTTARRRALDRLRHRGVQRDKQADVVLFEQLERDASRPDDDPIEIPDERLALVFTCCHPALPEEGRVALTLRTLGGLQTHEIARCFLVPEPTIAQRLVRAKRRIAELSLPFRVPEKEELAERLESVLAVIYLVFNEGYSATTGALLRRELTSEAIRLARLLCELLPEPEVEGLLALVLLQDSRRDARTGPNGELVTLEQQDRTRWDRDRIAEGTALVKRALGRRRAGPYQLQAAIAAVHGEAATAAETDWRQIVGLYTALHSVQPTPVVALNRAAALAMAAGPEAGLGAMAELGDALADYHLFHAARADLLRRLGRRAEAAVAYREALSRVTNPVERAYLEKRLGDLTEAGRAS